MTGPLPPQNRERRVLYLDEFADGFEDRLGRGFTSDQDERLQDLCFAHFSAAFGIDRAGDLFERRPIFRGEPE